MPWIFLGAGTLIILAMGGYALMLLRQLKRQKEMIFHARQARVDRLKASIIIIAKAMQSKECNLSEGVIRIKMLLAPLGLDFTPYPAMQRLYQVVQDMPTHQHRQALKRSERMRLDLTRTQAEDETQSDIEKELPHLMATVQAFSLAY